ncbi:MAG: A/G-specific adenine glycosylase [Alphaproteobacteria bacterium]|nr:A/G-specific adenine glycosylase [Alphaproteobacteria bacterium]
MGTVAELQRACAPAEQVQRNLLRWYDRERRDLPWRYAPGAVADPYRVWLSEIMLQQTTVRTVIPYFEKFTSIWPSVVDLAAADEEQVLQAWSGLGYYSRARNLHACARRVVEEFAGEFPDNERDLLTLPGVGPYTAAAIASIAFGRPATPVDGNIERVVARLFAVRAPMPEVKRHLRDRAATLTPGERAGDFAQAMMDLGATVCTPKRPSCLVCPLQHACEANALGVAAELPYRSRKPDRPVRRGIAFVALSEDGRLLLRRRPDTGLLARMHEVPSTDWLETRPVAGDALRGAPVRADWWPVPGLVVHTFTHFRLELEVYRAVVAPETELTFWADHSRCRWVPRHALAKEALPTLMRKVIAHGLAQS